MEINLPLSTILILVVVSFIQNFAFTVTSRSRNSGDPSYHRYAAWGSNGIWFACYVTIMRVIWEDLMAGNWVNLLIVGVIYTLITAEGSVAAMKWALRTEKGKRRVGSRKDGKNESI